MNKPPPRTPIVLLATMTASVIAGPFGIGAILRGGASPDWPPDRPVEWAVVLGTSGLVAALMMACLSLALANRRTSSGSTKGPSGQPEDRP